MLKRTCLLALFAVASATACSGSDDATTLETEPAHSVESDERIAPTDSSDLVVATDSTEPADSGTESVEAFCAEYASLQGELPESYVGSPEHLADVEVLLVVAPDAVAADLVTFGDYLSSGAIDSEADPDSNLVENWPADVQAAIGSMQAFAEDTC